MREAAGRRRTVGTQKRAETEGNCGFSLYAPRFTYANSGLRADEALESRGPAAVETPADSIGPILAGQRRHVALATSSEVTREYTEFNHVSHFTFHVLRFTFYVSTS